MLPAMSGQETECTSLFSLSSAEVSPSSSEVSLLESKRMTWLSHSSGVSSACSSPESSVSATSCLAASHASPRTNLNEDAIFKRKQMAMQLPERLNARKWFEQKWCKAESGLRCPYTSHTNSPSWHKASVSDSRQLEQPALFSSF